MTDYERLRELAAFADAGRRGGRGTPPSWIAACDPDTIRGLLDELDAARAEAERLRAVVDIYERGEIARQQRMMPGATVNGVADPRFRTALPPDGQP